MRITGEVLKMTSIPSSKGILSIRTSVFILNKINMGVESKIQFLLSSHFPFPAPLLLLFSLSLLSRLNYINYSLYKGVSYSFPCLTSFIGQPVCP